ERNRNSKKYFLCGLIMVVVLTITANFIGSKANYRMTASIPLTEGKVTASPYDINIVAMFINEGDGKYQEQNKDVVLPIIEYTINEKISYCYKGTNKDNREVNAKIYTNILGEHVFSGVSKSSKCILYLDKIKDNCDKACQYILSNINNINIRRKDYLPFYNNVSELNAPTSKTMYKALDEDGTTYYFAGNPTDNWVEFGGYYWRIIRINGDGSIRLIYQGRTEDENGNKLEPQTTGDETQIGTSKFNEFANDNTYVGFMYGAPGSTTYETTHENKNDSLIKNILDRWFIKSNIKQGSLYFDKIDLNAGFCGDRQSSSSRTGINGNGGMGTTSTYYGAYVRLLPNGAHPTALAIISPTFNCANTDDLYTYIDANQGNKKLSNPIGLITADEASYAGLVYGEPNKTSTNYLYTNRTYWTITPSFYENENSARVINVNLGGSMYAGSGLPHNVTFEFGIRPVINLRSDVEFTGNGTIDSPYKVV
ncbi:MAG: hypothetical protein NC483_07105, partial [Ruminococcus sp.]|nr:hypothetical protein [Ruminococcus sp.]